MIRESIKGHRDWVKGITYSLDGTRYASGSFDGTVKIWDAESGELLAGPLPAPDRCATFAVAFSPDGLKLVSGHEDGSLVVWDTQYWTIVSESQSHHAAIVYAVAYSPDGQAVVSGSNDATLQVWDATTGIRIGLPFRGHGGAVRTVAYSPDGHRIISGSSDSTVRIWDVPTANYGELKGHTKDVIDVAYASGGHMILSASEDETIRFWNASDGTCAGRICRRESLWDPTRQFFLSIPEWWPESRLKVRSLVYSADPTIIPEDGWIRTMNGGLLVWVPPEHRECSCHLAGRVTTTSDDGDENVQSSSWKGLPCGEDWTRVMDLRV